jgi:SAM-dependent methyltransferase
MRAIYSDFYSRMLDVSVPGPILEVGGGSGNFKQSTAGVVSTDILPAPWLDAVCDAQRLPFTSGAFANVMMVDVLHHVERPLYALSEAARVLRPGGRLIFCEPAITPLSGLCYRNLHPEPVDMSVNPLVNGEITPGKDPWLSNQAIPTLLVGRYRETLTRVVPSLALLNVDRFSFFAYPLSGGFRPWSLLPEAITETLLTIEWKLHRVLGRLAAFRMLVVYEKRD